MIQYTNIFIQNDTTLVLFRAGRGGLIRVN